MSSCVRILVIGDPHFNLKSLPTVDTFIQQTIGLVEARKPDVVVILGDVLHTHNEARVECHMRAVSWFKELAAYSHTVVMMGNHDRPNRDTFLTNEHFFTGLEGYEGLVIVATGPYSFSVTSGDHTFRFVAVPWVPKGRLHEALSKLKVSITDQPPAAVFSHQDLAGAKMGAVVCRDGDVWPAEYPLLVNGHYHEHQVKDNIFMPGTPYQMTYSEENNKGIYMFTFHSHKKDPEISRIKLNLRIKTSVVKTPSEFAAMKPPELGYELRVVVQGKEAEIEGVKVSKQYKEFSKLPNVKLVLVPLLDANALKKSVENHVGYIHAIYKRVESDPELSSLCHQLFDNLQ